MIHYLDENFIEGEEYPEIVSWGLGVLVGLKRTELSLIMKKIPLMFSPRPEAIKLSPLVKGFQKHPDKIEDIVRLTGQHRDKQNQVQSTSMSGRIMI